MAKSPKPAPEDIDAEARYQVALAKPVTLKSGGRPLRPRDSVAVKGKVLTAIREKDADAVLSFVKV